MGCGVQRDRDGVARCGMDESVTLTIMGKVMPKVRLTNFEDLVALREGRIVAERVRSIEVDALVDTGATMLMIPEDVRVALGLPVTGERSVRYANGSTARIPRVAGVWLEVLG